MQVQVWPVSWFCSLSLPKKLLSLYFCPIKEAKDKIPCLTQPAQHLSRNKSARACTQAIAEAFWVIVKTHKSKLGSTTSGNYKRVGLDVDGDHTVS